MLITIRKTVRSKPMHILKMNGKHVIVQLERDPETDEEAYVKVTPKEFKTFTGAIKHAQKVKPRS